MATKSDELIENAVVPKKRGRPSLKVSKKETSKNKASTSKKATKKTNNKKSCTTKSKSTSSKKEIAIKPEELIENPVVPKKRGRPSLKVSKKETTKEQSSTSKKSTKRTIKNISVKKTADSKAKDEKTISETQSVSIKASPSKNDRNLPKKKRTLKLTLESSKQQKVPEEISMISPKEESSINQNSSFFNEPSIFAKFNIDITSADSEDMSLEQTNSSITSTLSELEIDNSETTTEFESIENVDEEKEDKNIISNDIEESDKLDLDDSVENNVNVSAYNLENDVEYNSNNNDLLEVNNDKSLHESSTPNIEVENKVIDENIESKAVAENIAGTDFVQKVSDKGPIGKFFDSSIPSITSEKNTFSKITKSVFSSISPIFKKFTFEDVNLINSKFENTSTQTENNLTDIQKTLENFTPNITNISEIPVNAEPILTIPSTTIEKTTETISADLVNTKNISDYSNILTPVSDTSYNYEDELENPDEYEFSNKLINKLAEEETDFENTTSSKDNVDTSDINLDDISLEDLEKFKTEEYDDETFSIESYFGIDKITETNTEIITEEKIEDNTENNIEKSNTKSSPTSSEEFINKFLETNSRNKHISKSINQNLETDNSKEYSLVNNTVDSSESISNTMTEKNLEISNISKLLESYTQTISTLSEKISNLENKQIDIENVENNYSKSENELIEQKLDIEDINLDDIDINDLNLDELENLNLSFENSDTTENLIEENQSSVENMLSEAFLSKDFSLDVKDELLSEVLSSEENNLLDIDLESSLLEEALLENLSRNDLEDSKESTNLENNLLDASSDFSKIIDSLTKAITELEQTPDIKQKTINDNTIQKSEISSLELPNELLGAPISEEKAINILINKDDIFSISILNETYEIVADFDGISVLSENLHISTPKNNFFVKVENKYIEIHKQKDCFILYTNFEDIEFANAINNITFTKKNSKIELNIKEAFKLSSVNNKIELSMLNKAIANLSSNTSSEQQIEENSICDNRTLLISEETQKVYLPYTIEEVMKKLRDSEEYQTVQEVIDNEYTLPLSTFRMPIISRFREAYRFMRVKEKSSIYAAIDLALELMFNSNLNPAVIRAAKDMKELNIYLDCLYENEVEKFDCFKIIYKVLPKIK